MTEVLSGLHTTLAGVIKTVDGALAVAVGTRDGLIIEQYPQDAYDLSPMVAEQAALLVTTAKAYKRGLPRLSKGQVIELVFSTDKLTCYAQLLDNDLFCFVLMKLCSDLKPVRQHLQSIKLEIIHQL